MSLPEDETWEKLFDIDEIEKLDVGTFSVGHMPNSIFNDNEEELQALLETEGF